MSLNVEIDFKTGTIHGFTPAHRLTRCNPEGVPCRVQFIEHSRRTGKFIVSLFDGRRVYVTNQRISGEVGMDVTDDHYRQVENLFDILK